MRTDVKVGSVIAIVLVLVGVWFFVVRGRGPDTPAARPEAKKTPPEQTNVAVIEAPRQGEAVRRTDVGPTMHPAQAEGATTRPSEEVRIAYASERPTYLGPPGRTPDRPGERAADWWRPGRSVPSRITPSRTEPYQPAETLLTGRVRSQASGYRVKEGDTYWSIARAEYGDATLYGLLEKANANIPAKSLRPKMTIRIPPRPEKPAAIGPRAPAVAHGTTDVDDGTGGRYYVVRKGDNGFWAISKVVFRTPRRWQEIAALNPGVDPARLKPGQKVWVPKVAVETVLRTRRERPLPTLRATAAAPPAWGGVGAPGRTALPDGRIFD